MGTDPSQPGADGVIMRCFRESTASANEVMLKAKKADQTDEQQKARQQRAQPADDEEIVVFLDNTKSFREGTRLHDAKVWLKGLWPEFERTRTSFHFIGGSQGSVSANEFKDRVEAAGGQYEDTAIRATLIWHGGNQCVDLDLHVIEPSGVEIYYRNMKSHISHGFLDVDAGYIGRLCDSSEGPVENIRWVIGSQPLEARYEVKVKYFSSRGLPVQTVSFKVEVQVEGMQENRVFDGRVSAEKEVVSIFSFDYIRGGIDGFSRVSNEVYESSAVPNITYLDLRWRADAWSTYLWKYAYDVLLQKGSRGMTKWRAIFFVDGYDNDSPGAFRGPTGYNEMMNQLFRHHVRPEINIICFGSEECEHATRHAEHNNGADNPWLVLALSTGGTFQHVPEHPSDDALRIAIDDFVTVFADSAVKRIAHRKAAKRRWLELTMSNPVSVANSNQEYTKDLQLLAVDADVLDDEDTPRSLKDLATQAYQTEL